MRSLGDDNFSDDQLKGGDEQEAWQRQYFNGYTLKAAKPAGKPEAAVKLKTSIETPPPGKKLQSGYWLNRGRFEAMQGHTRDALAYYQLALQTRTEAPKSTRGQTARRFDRGGSRAVEGSGRYGCGVGRMEQAYFWRDRAGFGRHLGKASQTLADFRTFRPFRKNVAAE